MTRKEKLVFIRDIMTSLHNKLKEAAKKVPDEWDGLELRQYIADKVQEDYNYLPLSGKRLKEYKNDCLVNNL